MSRGVASRYQPVLVALHWLLALMIIGLLCIGFFVLANMPNTDPKKIDVMVWHMTGGMFVLALMILRIIIRIWSDRPATATTGSPLVRATHDRSRRKVERRGHCLANEKYLELLG
jgi:cytochrome b561